MSFGSRSRIGYERSCGTASRASRDRNNAPSNLVAAEDQARISHRGIWASSASILLQPAPTVPPSDRFTAVPPTSSHPPSKTSRWLSIDWPRVKEYVRLWGGIGTAAATAVALASYLFRVIRRTRVFLLFLGPQGVGKTWLWARLVNPEDIEGRPSENWTLEREGSVSAAESRAARETRDSSCVCDRPGRSTGYPPR